MTPFTDRLRVFFIGFVALTLGMPMAWISLGKLVLLLSGAAWVGMKLIRQIKDESLSQLWTVRVVFLILFVFALSIAGTDAPQSNALQAFSKHSKLLEIVLLVALLRSRTEALSAIGFFLTGQSILILSSWAMAAGIPIPWATSNHLQEAKNASVVFSTYLDQSLIFAGSAAVCWHLRRYWPRFSKFLIVISLCALVNSLFLQEGRTGYIASLLVLSMAVTWELPRKLRIPAMMLVPLALVIILYTTSSQFQKRVSLVVNETQTYGESSSGKDTSVGFRLHAWRRSVQAIAEAPVLGHGVGSWTLTVRRLEGAHADEVFGKNLGSNAHNEFLMWGVELGVAGIVLLSGLFAAIARDAWTFNPPAKRATLTMLGVMLVACVFNAPLYDALIGDYFCIALGLLMALGIRERGGVSQEVTA